MTVKTMRAHRRFKVPPSCLKCKHGASCKVRTTCRFYHPHDQCFCGARGGHGPMTVCREGDACANPRCLAWHARDHPQLWEEFCAVNHLTPNGDPIPQEEHRAPLPHVNEAQEEFIIVEDEEQDVTTTEIYFDPPPFVATIPRHVERSYTPWGVPLPLGFVFDPVSNAPVPLSAVYSERSATEGMPDVKQAKAVPAFYYLSRRERLSGAWDK